VFFFFFLAKQSLNKLNFIFRFHSRTGANTFGMPQLVRTQYNARGVLLPGRMAVPSADGATPNTDVNKSKSVENLNNEPYGLPVLGLKPANSEMNILRHPSVAHLHPPKPSRLRGTTSELNVSKLGQSEKVRFEMIEGIASLPAEMAKGLRPNPIKPNREKIRTILSMSNVIELQRQLLTTVMENEVGFVICYCCCCCLLLLLFVLLLLPLI
jgi:hypothetical protein